MSLFPRFSSHHDASIRPLFRLLEDPSFHQLSPSSSSSNGSSSHRQIFQPNFDVHETKQAYILDGELPGLSDKSKIDIEFVDEQTLVVKGRVERVYQTSDDKPNKTNITSSSSTENKPRQPTVEDVSMEGTPDEQNKISNTGKENMNVLSQSQSQSQSSAIGNGITSSSEMVVSSSGPGGERKYWVSERVVGEFQRSFAFPQGIDQDAVKATLNHGILNIVVPKRVSKGSRKITVE